MTNILVTGSPLRTASNASYAGASAFILPTVALGLFHVTRGSISTETQVYKWHSFPVKQRFSPASPSSVCVSRGRIADVGHLRSFYRKHISSRRRQARPQVDRRVVGEAVQEKPRALLPFLNVHSRLPDTRTHARTRTIHHPVAPARVQGLQQNQKRLSAVARQYL